MTDWSSQAELMQDTQVFIKLQHALLGLYAWEFIISLDFDWAVLTGKKKFRWPLCFYFAGRYLLLFALIGIAIALDTTKPINCQALYAFLQFAGDAAVGMASINLSLRTIAIWSRNKYIIGLLLVIILGHWSLILQGVLLKAAYYPGEGCAITDSNTTVLSATFIYSMCFDLIVLCLSTYKLAWEPRRKQMGAQSQLVKMIFADGLVYFFIAFVANAIATVFMIMNWNAIMSVIFNVPAAIASTIVASRVVRRLTNFRLTGPEIYSNSQQPPTSNLAYTGTNGVSRTVVRTASTKVGPRITGPTSVHVEMETFTRAENMDIEAYPHHMAAMEQQHGVPMGVIAGGHDFREKEGSETSYEDDIKAGHGL